MSSPPLRHWRHGLLLVLLAAGAPELWAQDVTVGAPVWLLPGPPPDELPKPKHALRPEYPRELSKSTELGYVMVFRYVDASGQSLVLDAQGTHIPFKRAVEAELRDWKMTPARRGGASVDAYVWLPVIFNPANATSEARDRNPRLLAVAPVILQDLPPQTNGSPIVNVRLQLDATGKITHLAPEGQLPDKLLEAVNAALKNWRFAPASRDGQPVAAEITVPVLLCQALLPKGAAKGNPPKAITRVEPVYPRVMERFGLRGKVLVEFVVDRNGQVQNPVIKSSDNPAFDEPALEALFRWKFQPGTIDGRTVNTRAVQTFEFRLRGEERNIFEIREHADQSKLPPEMRYDVAAKIRGVQIPVYPYAQRREGARGKATATMLIDQEGRVSAVKVQSADSPEFGLALTAAMGGFAFDPAVKAGKPVPQLISFEQVFNTHELPDDKGDWLLSVEKKHPEKIVPANKLDAPLKPISRRPPVFPRSLDPAVTTGEALVECLIDERGRVHLPRIVSASDPAFGYAAVQAVAAWWFEPPKKDGQPVVTRVQVPFEFKQNLPPATTNSP